MKKQLLLGSLLFAVTGAYSQNGRIKPSASITNMAEKLASKYDVILNANENNTSQNTTQAPIGPQYNGSVSKSAAAINWTKISGSMNIYGMLEISGKPLQYNPELNAVSFVHRKSATYVPSPVATPSTAASGVIVGMVSANCGQSWDSTCIWNNNTLWARFPQGGIYNPPGNTNLANAYIVATGPLTQASNSWWGSYLASKKLDAPAGSGFNNVASSVSNAQQAVANTNSTNPLSKFDFPSFDFSSSGSNVKSLGEIVADFNGTGSARKYRGARVLYGNFNSGTFNWASDSIILSANVVTTTAGALQLFGQPHMAWSENGQVGYVMHIGCRQGATGSNMGFQPIVYKTTNAGSTWTLMPAIDFTQPAFQSKVLDRIQPVHTNSNLAIPMFNLTEGIDCTVDKNNHLHIVSTVIGTRNEEVDSLGFIYNFNNSDGEKYNFPHVPGARPYIYDFMETSAGWNVAIIDSMSSEAPGERSTDDGFTDNPWDPAGGSSGSDKVSSCARIQVSRTPDGKFIVYSWAESDTNFTNGGNNGLSKKWNSIPNIKTRAYSVDAGVVSHNEINLTPSSGSGLLISSRAQMHHISPKCAFTSTSNLAPTVLRLDVNLPTTVSTNQSVPLTQLLPNDHWYSCAGLTFLFGDVGVNEIASNKILNTSLFPNPANSNVNLNLELKSNGEVKVNVINLLGEVVSSTSFAGQLGDNTINLNLNGLAKGIYMVNVQAGGSSGNSKLIVE
ncbi:MAG: T9SS type A sorting domain-containing protein [Bacteroidia bacterium]|nr:T9SS type A sorting domain-containing protein [Bacteroidia bacterium]